VAERPWKFESSRPHHICFRIDFQTGLAGKFLRANPGPILIPGPIQWLVWSGPMRQAVQLMTESTKNAAGKERGPEPLPIPRTQKKKKRSPKSEANTALAGTSSQKDSKRARQKARRAEPLYGLRPAVVDAVAEAARAGQGKRVRRLLYPLHFSDVADLLERLPSEIRKEVVEHSRRTLDPAVLTELDEAVRKDVVGVLDRKRVAAAVQDLETDDAVEILEDLNAKTQQEILSEVGEVDRALIEEALSFPEDSAGRLMQRITAAIPQSWTVGETIDHMRDRADLPDDFYDLFVVDARTQTLSGILPLSRLLREKRSARVKQIMLSDVTRISAEMDQEEVAMLFRDRDLVSAPVVDEGGRLVGMITIDDVVDVIDEEAHEDILKLAGVGAPDFYQDTLATVRRRFGWLGANLITAILASLVIGLFSRTLEQIVALAILMPIVASMGGNAGTQTLTVTVRAIAMRDFGSGLAWRFILKEVVVGGINGILFAVVMGVVAWFWFGSIRIAIIIGLAMGANLVVAGLAGAMVPLALERRGVDPAIASTVILTTVTDIVGFLSFLGLATAVLI
jgi:magnesium transporter